MHTSMNSQQRTFAHTVMPCHMRARTAGDDRMRTAGSAVVAASSPHPAPVEGCTSAVVSDRRPAVPAERSARERASPSGVSWRPSRVVWHKPRAAVAVRIPAIPTHRCSRVSAGTSSANPTSCWGATHASKPTAACARPTKPSRPAAPGAGLAGGRASGRVSGLVGVRGAWNGVPVLTCQASLMRMIG